MGGKMLGLKSELAERLMAEKWEGSWVNRHCIFLRNHSANIGIFLRPNIHPL
jgi:hypothetical protein